MLATNPSLEGEATAAYLHRSMEELKHVKVTRIARGLPVGGDLDYAEGVTISPTLAGRRDAVGLLVELGGGGRDGVDRPRALAAAEDGG